MKSRYISTENARPIHIPTQFTLYFDNNTSLIMYTSILTTLLLTSTTLAATLPPSLGHGPVVPSEYDSEVASPIAKRQGLPLGDTLGLGTL
jgi:hypothetical protein